MQGTVVGAEGGIYTLALDDGRRVGASLRGRLKMPSPKGDRVVIGDRVEVVEGQSGTVTIEALLTRRSAVVRRSAKDRGAKVVAANVDRLFAVVAVEPRPRAQLVDRLLVVAEANAIPSVLVLNKMDLPGAAEVAPFLTARYRALGYPVLAVSARAQLGLEGLRELLCDGTSALIGPSGVGKSTLLNAVEPGLQLRTGGVSRKHSSGRHTTVASRLIMLLCGGVVADTPGFSDVGLWEMEPAELDCCFPELRELKGSCRFRGCAHLEEPDCAVRAAVEEGRIAQDRYESYVILRGEAEAARSQEPGGPPLRSR